MTRARRRLYRPERAPARKKGVLHKQAPIGCPNATPTEIAMALFSIGEQAHMIPGRGGTYDSLKDQYTLVGKVLDGGKDSDGTPTGKVQDIVIEGADVAFLIRFMRTHERVRQLDSRSLLRQLDGKNSLRKLG